MELSRINLDDGARIAVIGGGPAASFFAISLLREARIRGLELDLRIFERRGGTAAPGDRRCLHTSGCNFCAGGVSPRMSDVLDDLGIEVPPEIIQDRVRTIRVQSHWKNLEMRVPEDRRMYSVYRGARPRARAFRLLNFDSVLLGEAARAGATVVNAEVTGLRRSADGRPRLTCRRRRDEVENDLTADFAVYAGGVNRHPGHPLDSSGLLGDLGRVIPGFSPPSVRRTLIFELEVSDELAASMRGELTFILFGSPDLRIEMGSLMPKGRFVTVVLIGPDIDRAPPTRIVESFLSLPHIERILPRHLVVGATSCVCRPSMVVGCATSPVGDRVGVIGDMVTSRLYKDGIYTAYLTASGLARTALAHGVDGRSLARGYLPLIRRLETDLQSGRTIFLTMAWTFGNPVLSRMTYQAVLRERRTLPRERRRLERILWQIASGDVSYARILRAMLHPRTILSFLFRGVFITARNWLTELVFGLSWKGLGRFPTGVTREERDARVRDLSECLGSDIAAFRDFRRMYTIRILAPAERIVSELGRLGDPEKEYLRPRFVDVRRVSGRPNETGSEIEYSVSLKPLSFRMVLERSDRSRGLLYRVRNGFARGGVLVLDVEKRHERDCRLSVLVAFDFRRGGGLLKRIVWSLYRRLFPTFVHDVIWNHALCRIKDVVERRAPKRRLTLREQRRSAG